MTFVDDIETCFVEVLSLEEDMDKVVKSFKHDEYFDGLIAVKNFIVDLKNAINDCKEIERTIIKIIKMFEKINLLSFCFELLFNGF